MTLRIEYPGKTPVWCSLAYLVSEGEHGRAWYRESRKSIVRYAKSQGFCPDYVADVLAILSPRVSVSRNISMTKEYLETGAVKSGAMKARLKALQVYEKTGKISGPKITSFSRALRGDEEACVVDTWIFRAFGMTSTHLANYKRAEKRIVRASNRFGWTVAETQAAVWVGTKVVCGFNKVGPIEM